jgi:hypothetical protein
LRGIEGLVRIKKAAKLDEIFGVFGREKVNGIGVLKGTRVCQCCHQGIFVLGEKGRRPKKKHERKWWFVVGVEYKVKFLTLFWSI